MHNTVTLIAKMVEQARLADVECRKDIWKRTDQLISLYIKQKEKEVK